MKYDILYRYRDYLKENCKSPDTAKTYYHAVKKLFDGMQFDRLDEIPEDLLLKKTAAVTGKSRYSAAKRGVELLGEFSRRHPDYGKLAVPDGKKLRESAGRKKDRVKSAGKVMDYRATCTKIGKMPNEKYRLAYMMMLKGGLRVSETAGLTPDDIKIDGRDITARVRKGKGGKTGLVTISDKKLAEDLKRFMARREPAREMFYSASSLKNTAGASGFECHDLRRIAAIMHRRQAIKNGTAVYQANAEVQKFLRHERFSVTKRYLFGRKLAGGRPQKAPAETKTKEGLK